MIDDKPIDREDFLASEDKEILRKKFRKDFKVMVMSAIVIAAFVTFMGFSLTIYHWVIGFLVWLIAAIAKFFRNQNVMDRGKKNVLRGVIAQRYESGGRGDEDKGHVFFINGKRLQVPPKIYKEYYTRDIVEIHLIDDIILQHKLIRRGNKVFNR